jgi:hypothetical protein
MSTIKEEKQHAHELVERLDASQLPTAVRFMEFMLLDPVARAIATAPIDDEPVTEAERQAVAEADEWLKHNKPIPFEDVLTDFGLTVEDLKNRKESE